MFGLFIFFVTLYCTIRRNVLQQMLLLRLMDTRDWRNVPIYELATKVGKMVVDTWIRANRRLEKAVVSQQEVTRKIFLLYQKLESYANPKNTTSHNNNN